MLEIKCTYFKTMKISLHKNKFFMFFVNYVKEMKYS